MIEQLPPIPVALPLVVAGLLLAVSRALPGKTPDIVAVVTVLASGMACSAMAAHAADGPITYWFGGWTPRNGQQVGISFAVDEAGATLGTFISLLFAATFVFAWGYFDEVHAHFHVLMLLFMAGMIGFCLTHDIFNMFVWFELMSFAAFSVTGYQLGKAQLVGALNFTVVNTIGSYLILGGIGLIYAKVGALDFSALAKGIAADQGDPLIAASFTLVAMGFLIKAAQVPFQPWLADAHAVAPSPVSVIFSGAMVALGVFGLSRMVFDVFPAAPEITRVVSTLLLGMGAVTAVLGAIMCVLQRHIKRLLAFSTISHTGILLIGLASLNQHGVAGLLAYMVGHGLVKGSLFMTAGMIEARCGGIDEIGLRGAGRSILPAGVLMGVGALMLAGLPCGLMDGGIEDVDSGLGANWLKGLILFGAACTGAAILRVTGRVFLGLGEVPGEEERAPTDEEQEKADRPLPLMMAPAILLMVLAFIPSRLADPIAQQAAMMLMHSQAAAGLSVSPAPATLGPWFAMAFALALAAYQLAHRILPTRLTDKVIDPVADVLHRLHSGLIGDYVAWVVAGLALFTVAFALI